MTVLGELKVQQDALAQWVTDNASLFLGPTEESLNANSAVIRWVQANYEPVGFSAFANSTDMSLVSYAAAQGHRRDARAHGVPITETDQDS